MKTNNPLPLFIALVGTALLSACAGKVSVIAKRNPAYSPSLADRISLTERSIPNPELDALKRAVTSELSRGGTTIVAWEDSQYALSCWIDESWEGSDYFVQPTLRYPDSFDYDYQAEAYRYGGAGVMMAPHTVQPSTPAQQPRSTRHYTKGIRMRLFVSHPQDKNRLETAWDGYIAGGARLSPQKYDPLLRKLFDYFGKDFTGTVSIE
jgi:hypothetical protein